MNRRWFVLAAAVALTGAFAAGQQIARSNVVESRLAFPGARPMVQKQAVAILQAGERELAHGNDERVPVAGVGLFVEYLYRVVVDIAGAK